MLIYSSPQLTSGLDAKFQHIKCIGIVPQDLARQVLCYDYIKKSEKAPVSLLKSHLLTLNRQFSSDCTGIVCIS